MPATHVVSVTPQVPLYTVKRKGKDEPVNVIKEDNATERVYVSYVNLGKRMDEWVPLSLLEPIPGTSGTVKRTSRKRKRTTPASNASGSRNQSIHSDEEAQPEEQNVDMEDSQQQEIVMTEEDYDIQHHKQIGAVRNFDRVHFGQWSIRTWYYSPYPFADNEDPDPASSSNSNANRIPGVSDLSTCRTSNYCGG
ncbi:hypothetical protein MPER_11222 [Moniliophthora perniciosa FA553]|nr:hypothetical protein MPER_11222 [Moniliophthora perniciosa FA553]